MILFVTKATVLTGADTLASFYEFPDCSPFCVLVVYGR